MSMTGFLKVNGSLRGGRGDTRWFQLPGKSFSARSVRFGHHALVLDEMMRILPLGDSGRASGAARAQSTGNEAERGRIPGLLSSGRWLSLFM